VSGLYVRTRSTKIVLPHHARARFRLLRHRRRRRDRDLTGRGLHLPGAAAPIPPFNHCLLPPEPDGSRPLTYLMRFSNGDARRSAAKRFNFAWPAPSNARPGDRPARLSHRFRPHLQGRIVTAKMSTKAKARTDVRAFDRSGFGTVRITRPLRALFRRRQASRPLRSSSSVMRSTRLSVVRIDAGTGRADQRHGIGLWLVDLDEFLQGMNQFLAEVFRGNSGIGEFPGAKRPGSYRYPDQP